MFFLQLLLCQTHSHPINFSSMSTPQRAFPCYLGTHPAPCNLAVSCLLLRIWLVVLEVSDSTCCYFSSLCFQSVISSVQLFSHVQFFMTLWTAECQASLSITNSRRLPKLMSSKLVMPPNHLILCRPLLLLSSIFPSIRVFSNESVLLHQVARVLEFQL